MSEFVPYEASHRLRKLLFVVVIVNYGQGEAISALAHENEAFFTIVHYAKGTAPRDFYALSSSAMPKKEAVFTILREDKWLVFKNQLKERFSVSAISKGVAFTVPVDAVAGVSIYKTLSNTRIFEKPIAKNKEKKHG